MNDDLFSPLSVGGHQLKNRFVMPAMHLGLAKEGVVSEAELQFYRRRAAAEVGLVMVGLCNTLADGQADITGVLELSSDATIDPMAALHRAISDGGAHSAVQLSPISGYNNPAWMPDEQMLKVLIDSIGKAAGRAQRAGFDFVELMLSGGSMLSHIVSPHHNHIEMKRYRGSLENRLRAPLEALDAIDKYAKGMPVIVRVHGHEYLENGFGLEEAADIARGLEQHGVCAINVTVAGHRTTVPQITRQRTGESFAFLGRNIKDAVSVPVFYGSRIRTAEDARSVFFESGADAITVGRALIADESFVVRVKEQHHMRNSLSISDDIVNCVGCCHCLDMAFSKKPVRCTVNPGVRLESTIGRLSSKVTAGDRVLVAGSGPAGMHAAILLANHGAEVTLAERENELGGKWRKVGELEGHQDLQGALHGSIQRLSQAGVCVVTGQEVTSEYVQAMAPRLLIWATGSVPVMASIPGINCHPRVMHVQDLIDTSERISFEHAVIIGGNAAGVTAALHLAKRGFASNEAVGYLHRFGNLDWATEAADFEPKRTVTVLKRRGFFGKGMGRAMRWTAVQEMKMYHVNTVDKVQYDNVEQDGIWVIQGRAGERRFFPADLIILATGFSKSSDVSAFTSLGVETVVIGDAEAVGDITAATHGLEVE
ncbi:MAG: FAD-dependent oxidoreductase [Deltaproteobacteria bacterium]|nr:FAD-dependent oxidoreductase [Deltaproteobacteria bacterium]MBN2670071.1 FAD-dependent oxidoreductase [Deltaproteobacteria bacterium]